MSSETFQALEDYQDNFAQYKAVESELLWQGSYSAGQPEISILIITNKRPALFQEAFQSACAQKCDNLEWEILVMDNNPNETEVLKIIDRENNQRVRYYRNKENIGHEGNMNRGIELARGNWVALLHDDDLLVENYLTLIQKYLSECSGHKKPLAYIRANYLSFMTGMKMEGYTANDEIEKTKYIKPELWIETLLRGCGPTYVNSCGSIVNRKAFIKVGGYNTVFNPIGDATLGLLFMRYGYNVFATENILGFYRQGENESIKKETMLELIEADFCLREYLYKRNYLTRIFGFFFRNAQYQSSVNIKMDMAKRYQKNRDEMLTWEDINRIRPYKKCRISGLLLIVMRVTLDLFYRKGKIIRNRLCRIRKKRNVNTSPKVMN